MTDQMTKSDLPPDQTTEAVSAGKIGTLRRRHHAAIPMIDLAKLLGRHEAMVLTQAMSTERFLRRNI
jgi:hypothetical protein